MNVGFNFNPQGSKWTNLSETPSCKLRISFTTWLKSIKNGWLPSPHYMSKWLCRKMCYPAPNPRLVVRWIPHFGDPNVIFLVNISTKYLYPIGILPHWRYPPVNIAMDVEHLLVVNDFPGGFRMGVSTSMSVFSLNVHSFH